MFRTGHIEQTQLLPAVFQLGYQVASDKAARTGDQDPDGPPSDSIVTEAASIDVNIEHAAPNVAVTGQSGAAVFPSLRGAAKPPMVTSSGMLSDENAGIEGPACHYPNPAVSRLNSTPTA